MSACGTWRRFATPLLVAMVMPPIALAQTSQPPPPLTIRVTTHMVLVDAVISDKQGKAIPNLHAEDVVIEENGKQQNIASFSTPAEKVQEPPQLPPGIYSNKPQYRSSGGPITLILLDALNTPFSDQAYARRQMLAFVKEQFRRGDRLGVFALTERLTVLQDFTTDPEILYTALERYKSEPQEFASASRPATSASNAPTAKNVVSSLDASTTPQNAAIAAAEAAAGSFGGAQVSYARDQRAVMTLNALQSIARILGGLPGRKNLIWVTGELPFSFIPEDRVLTQEELNEDQSGINTHRVGQHAAGTLAEQFRQAHAEEIREIAARLSGAQVAVYPVDARGLSISTNFDSQETMRDMARETGGRAYVNQNEIKVGVERAFADQSATYTIGYYPQNKKYDGKYRSIKVKVKTRGAEIQYRHGYYAIDLTHMKAYNPQEEMAAALLDVAPATTVSFTAQIKPPSANSVPGKIGVTFLVDANTLSAEDAQDGKRLKAVFYATILSPSGIRTPDTSQVIDRIFDANAYEEMLKKGLALHMDIDPQPGQIRLAVQDLHTGLVGTIIAPVPK
jgi:VWFA-related protein